MEQWQMQAIETSIQSALQAVLVNGGMAVFNLLWQAASTEQRQELVGLFIERARARIGVGGGDFELARILHTEGVIGDVVKSESARPALAEAITARAAKLIEESGDYRNSEVERTIAKVVTELVQQATRNVLHEQLPAIEKAVREKLTADIIDGAVRRQAEAMLKALQEGGAVGKSEKP